VNDLHSRATEIMNKEIEGKMNAFNGVI
jgi:hypothetical protein